MNKTVFEIIENRPIARDVYLMRLAGDTAAITAPGQFVNIRLDGLYLRRPISVCDWTEDTVTIIYKTVGKGTEQMSLMAEGETLDVLTPLGNGYDTAKTGDRPVLVGGGAGVPPMYGLCKALLAEGKKPMVVLGFNKENEIFYVEKFEELGAEVYVATADGSAGTKGFVTDVVKTLEFSHFCTCGPEPMLTGLVCLCLMSSFHSWESMPLLPRVTR